jgi:hypothetical protein
VSDVVIEVYFDLTSCTLRRNQRKEVIYVVCGRDGWGAGDFCNVGEDAVKLLENFGGVVGGDVK